AGAEGVQAGSAAGGIGSGGTASGNARKRSNCEVERSTRSAFGPTSKGQICATAGPCQNSSAARGSRAVWRIAQALRSGPDHVSAVPDAQGGIPPPHQALQDGGGAPSAGGDAAARRHDGRSGAAATNSWDAPYRGHPDAGRPPDGEPCLG